MQEFDGWCPVCGGEVTCLSSDHDADEYVCDDCGATLMVGRFITKIDKKEEQK